MRAASAAWFTHLADALTSAAVHVRDEVANGVAADDGEVQVPLRAACLGQKHFVDLLDDSGDLVVAYSVV